MFGNGNQKSLGALEIRLPFPSGIFLSLKIDVVNAEVPTLLGLDVLDREKQVPNNVDNKLMSKLRGWNLPIV